VTARLQNRGGSDAVTTVRRRCLLETVAANGDRISQTQHTNDPAVGKVQTAVLVWDPACLPDDDVGPRTVIRLDEIAAVSEATSAAGSLMIASATSTDDVPFTQYTYP